MSLCLMHDGLDEQQFDTNQYFSNGEPKQYDFVGEQAKSDCFDGHGGKVFRGAQSVKEFLSTKPKEDQSDADPKE